MVNMLDILSIKTSAYIVIFKSLLLLFSVYSIHFSFLGVLTARIISLFIVVIIYVFSIRKQIFRYKSSLVILDWSWISFNIWIVFYTFIISYFQNSFLNQNSIISSVFNFLIFCAIYVVISDPLFDDALDFGRCMMIATFIQSIIVISSFISPEAKSFLYSIQSIDTSGYTWRIVGLGVAGAGGSVYLLCGFLASLYIILKTNSGICVYFMLFIIFIAICLVGRTGFYCSIILILSAIYIFIRQKKEIVHSNIHPKQIAIVLFFLIIIFIVVDNYTDIFDNPLYKYTYNRLFELSEDGSNSFALQNINNTSEPIPRPSEMTLFGTGIIRGILPNGYNLQHDSGYVQRYIGLGIVMSILSYISLYIYITVWNKYTVGIIHFLFNVAILNLFIIEYKEPFIYGLAYPYVLIMFVRLESRERTLLNISQVHRGDFYEGNC